jgi:hypothetical protein
LSQQFTTITTGTATPGEISGAAAGTYCINTSPLLSPQAETS